MIPEVYVFADLRFDPADGRLARIDGGSASQLRPQVARLLLAFLDHPQDLIEREQLCRAVWDEGTVIDFESGLAAVLRELRAELKSLGLAADLIETVPRRGYRLNCQVRRAGPTLSLSRSGRKRLAGLSAALVLLLLSGLYALWPTPKAPPPDSFGQTLAVLPFSQFGEAADDPRQLDLLLADRVLAQLWEAQLEDVVLMGRASVSAYAGRDDLAAAVARDLGIALLLEGSVVFDAGRVSVSARLLDMPSGHILWSHELDFAQQQMPPVADLARMLVDALAREWHGWE